MLVALTRDVSSGIGSCELTHLDRRPIDVGRARAQHDGYRECLRDLGCRVESLPEEPDFPDSVFVEDIAIVLDEIAVITRPGARSRRGERASIEQALAPHRPMARIRSPGILDGGDVLTIGKDIYVGLSTRSSRDAADSLRELLGIYGYTVTDVEFRGCLHLKSAVTRLGECQLLVNPEWVDPAAFSGFELIEIDSSEPMAANALRVGETVLLGAEYPRTARRVAAAGFETRAIELSELAKAEGGLTCCSLLFRESVGR